MIAQKLVARSTPSRRTRALVALSTASLALAFGAATAPQAGAFGANASANPLAGSTFEGADAGLGPTAGVAQSPSASPAGRTDWSSYVGAGALPGLNTMDDPPAADSMFAGGDKELDPGDWGLTSKAGGVTPAKDDVRVAWGIADTRAAGTFFYLGLKRQAANGDTFITFELNQAAISWNNGSATIPCRQTGDLLISYELTPSGTPVDVVPHRWTSTDTQTVTTGGTTYHCAKHGTLAASASPDPSEVQAAMNWSNSPFTGSITNNLAPAAYGATFGEGLFGETSLNLSLILSSVSADPCANFGQWQIHSRSAVGGNSDTGSSQLQDLVGPQPMVVRSCGVTGFKFHDLNGDGTWQKTGAGAEPGLAGWTIYVDLNNDGTRQASEPSAVTAVNGSYTIGGVSAGDHMVREEAPSGAGSGWKCTAPAPDNTLPGPAAFDCGHLVHFTTGNASTDKDGHAVDFGNFETPRLTVIKHVVNDDGGSAAASAFQMDVTGGHVSDAHFAGSEAGHTVTLDAGSYSVDESGGPSGYTKSLSAGCSGSLHSGDTATCTVTNNDQPAHLTVIKHVVNDNGGSAAASAFQMDVTGGHVSSAHFAGAEAGNTVSLDAGSYSVDESGGPSGYTKTLSAGCSGTVAPGGSATCTITNNDQAPHLTVIKHVVNDDGGTAAASAFQMDVTGGHVSDAHFAGTEAGHTVSLDAGSYSADESGGPSGYTKSLSAGCSGTLAPGASATCTITNNDQAPHLTVIKHVVNDNGGSAAASAFQMDVTGGHVSDAHFAGIEAGHTVSLDAGSYSVDESGGPSGYTKTLSAGCSGTLAPGASATCTITNNDQAPHLTVIKHVINNDGGSAAASAFQMDVTGGHVSDAHFAGTEAGHTVSLDAGSYSADESGGPSGYTKSLSAGCSGTLAPGASATCTITNDDQGAHLTVIKHVVNDDGGAAHAADFQMDVTGGHVSDAHFAGVEAGHTVGLDAGSYSVDESGGPSGYTKSLSAACSGTLAPGASATCTITNNDQPAHLTVIKHVVNNDGGDAEAADFQMDVTGGHVSDAHFAGTEAGHTVSLDAGSYSADESGGPSGYAKSKSDSCAGTLAPGASATCTITNNDIAPRITVIKHVVGGGEASSFEMLVDATHPSDASFAGAESPGHTVTVDAGHYSVDEGDHAHYTETRSEGCDGTVAVGDERTCTITNVHKAIVHIQKLTVPADTAEQKQEFGFHTSLTGADTFQLTHGQVETREVDPGTYGVVEDDPKAAGYKLIGLECSENGAQDTVVVGSISGQRSVSIHAQAGETINCVYTNGLVVAGVEVVKSGPSFAYHGDTLDFTFAVHSIAASPLHDVTVTDDHCANVSANPVAKHNDDGDGLLEAIGLDGLTAEEWVFSCSMPVPGHQAGEENPIVNTASVTGLDEFDRSVHDTDNHSTKILHPAIDIDKTGPATANAGDVITYALTVTNPGDEAFADGLVIVTDALCEAPPFLVAKGDGSGADDTPATFDPGDIWLYGCRVRTLPTQTSVHNVADVTGTDEHGKVVRASDPADTVLQTPPAGAVEAAVAANPGTAKLSGPAGCLTRRAAAKISGKQISRVVFKLDGRRLASLSKANGKHGVFQVRVSPGSLRTGVHKLSARVTFKAASNTKPRTLRLAFQRCPKKVLPRFTG